MPDEQPTNPTLEIKEDAAAKAQRKFFKGPLFKSIVVVVLALIAAGAVFYTVSSNSLVKIDDSMISAPEIALSPTAAGTLNQVYVNNGDTVAANTPVALVGTEIIKTKVAGIIINTNNDIGKTYNPGQAVVTMIDPSQLRVVGTLDENKGLSKIAVGQPVSFTVDAFGSKQYSGVVDEVSPTSNQTGVVFNISSQRPTQQFDIKARFNTGDYSELKNGMSAKMTVFIK